MFLNDWAAAVPLGEKCSFFGALNFAADAVLNVYPESIEGQPSYDLEMIVKVMFACVHPAYFDRCFPKLHKDSEQEEFKLAIKRWQDIRKLEQWRLLFDAAKRADYVLLQQLIIKYLPSVPADLQLPATTAPTSAPLPAAALPAPIAATSGSKNRPVRRSGRHRK